MRKILLLVCIALINFSTYGQSYLGWATKQVNLREGPGTEYPIVKSLKGGAQIFIVSKETNDDFYPVIDIKSNTEGFIHKSFVKFGERVYENEPGLFNHEGSSLGYDSELEIHNDTSVTLTLKLNSERFSFSPHEKKTISISPGSYSYIASAPGVQPNIGKELLDHRSKYSWKFYIVTEQR